MRVLHITAEGPYSGCYGRYDDSLYRNTKGKDPDVEISRMIIGRMPVGGSLLAVKPMTLFKDFGEYDIVHNTSGVPFSPLRKNFINVATAHEMQPILYPELTKIRVNSVKDLLWDKLILGPALKSTFDSDYVFANSQLTLEGLLKGGFPRKRAFLTPLGLDDMFRKPVRAGKRRGKFKIGTIGSISSHKNTLFSIRAVRKLAGSDFTFEIWGKRIYKEGIIDAEIGGDSRIRLMGFAPENRILELYDSFDVFLYPTLYDGFGLPMIEAKARGLPVIIWKHGHVSPEVRKYCFEAEDEAEMAEIIERLKKEGYDEKLRRRAMEQARSFTWEDVGKKTLAAYKKMRP